MQNDEPVNEYGFVFVGDQQNAYSFSTYDKIRYEIRFTPSAYMFDDYIDGYVDAYEMVIAIADNPLGGRIPADRLTEPTIRAIFYDFFRSREQVIIFICDSSDGRHQARARKFTGWYYKDIDPRLFKFDAHVPDGKGSIMVSAIIDTRNQYFSQFVEVFKSFGDGDVGKEASPR